MPVAFPKKGLLAFSILSFVVCNTLFFTPGKELPDVGNWFGEFSFDKLLHTAIFCGMCFLFLAHAVLFYANEAAKKRVVLLTILFLLWAVATELIQSFLIEGRTGSLMDVFADAVGVLLAFVLVKKGLVKKLFTAR